LRENQGEICYNINMNHTEFYKKLQQLPDGANDGFYREKRYLLRKETLLDGRLIKLYAKELGGNDIVSGNYYPTIKGGVLKPCEMSDAKVIEFVLSVEVYDIVPS